MQMRRYKIRFSRINHIFISHLHGDHIFGLYGLLSSFSLMGRKSNINLYAPSGYGSILASHLADFDIKLGFDINFVPLSGKEPVTILDDKYLSVTAFPLVHRVPSFGFLFREKTQDRNILKESIEKFNIPPVRIPAIKKGADFITEEGNIIKNEDITTLPREPLSYAYCSDTKYFRRLSSFVKGVTLLYHEATFDKSKQELADMTCHSTTFDAARIAMEAGAGKLVIGHFSARYKDISHLVNESRSIFPNTVPAIDGRSYNVDGIDDI